MPKKVYDYDYREAQAMRDQGFSLKYIAKKLNKDAGTLGKRTTAKLKPKVYLNNMGKARKRKEEMQAKYAKAQKLRDKGLTAAAVAKEMGISISTVKANTRVIGEDEKKTVQTRPEPKQFETRTIDKSKCRRVYIPSLKGSVTVKEGDIRTDDEIRQFWQDKKDKEFKKLTIKKPY